MKKFLGYLLSIIIGGAMFIGSIVLCGYIKPYIESAILMDCIAVGIMLPTVIIACVIVGFILYYTGDDEYYPVEPQYNDFYRR